jgi:hypothetical protein
MPSKGNLAPRHGGATKAPRGAGLSDSAAFTNGKCGEGPMVLPGKSSGAKRPQLRRQPPQGPRCQPSPQPPATCVINDCCSNGIIDAGYAPASKEISATIQPAAMGMVSKTWENYLDSAAPRRISFAWPHKSRQGIFSGMLAAQSWTDSLLPASLPCASSTPISALLRRRRRGRG